VAGRRTNTEPGMGAARVTQKPVRGSGRAPPLACPAPRVPQIEDVGIKRPTVSRRVTMKRSGSSSDNVKIDIVGLGGAPLTSRKPRLTPKAATLDGLDLEPRDAFILSRIDGGLDAEDLADLTGLPHREVVATLERLARFGLVRFA
jgi:hypothetical protein